MKTVYFVRHGESESNLGHANFMGETSHLTEKGHEQAKFIAERVAKLDFDILIASPVIRAHDTAKYISESTHKPVTLEARFVERKLPRELLGKPRDGAEESVIYRRWVESLFSKGKKEASGENFEEIVGRAQSALDYLQARPEEKMVVVTHGFFLRVMLSVVVFGASVTPDEFKKIMRIFHMDNTGLTIIEHQHHGADTPKSFEGWAVRVWNDRAHLG